ncbi:serralysin [Roseomonas rosea]|uniref:Serralysin n=1 Tax=Muricoccus roseus TaxID=198092 RepID=A0A1M6M5A5_9PROT|nr:M10 family metallopeptidase [Roseomonas rosea]SHJ78618.1 serralysin [Roseomonas rosea]
MPATTSPSASGTPAIDGLLAGTAWAGHSLTYSFPGSAADLSDYSAPNAVDPSYVAALSSGQQDTVRGMLVAFGAVANITFSEAITPSGGDLRLYWYEAPDNYTARTVEFPSANPEAGDVQLGAYVVPGFVDQWTLGSYSYFTILHELGHALGLKHPHDEVNGFPPIPAAQDSIEYSIMSYRSYAGQDFGGYTVQSGSYPSGPMLNDIAALQYLYGANWTTNSGDTTYRFDPEQAVVFQTIWDGGGEDTYDLSAYGTDLVISLDPGGWSRFGGQYAVLDTQDGREAIGNVANAYLYQGDLRSLIENAIGGSGNDEITGNAGANALTGGAGDDTLRGGLGDDVLRGGSGIDLMVGGEGSDTYHVDSVGDRVREAAGEGGDVVWTGVDWTLEAGQAVEVIRANAGEAGLTLTGNELGNWLVSGAGADLLIGGLGNDSLYVNSAEDRVVELVGQGSDTVFASASYTLAAGQEIEILRANAGATGLVLAGNDIANRIVGGDGADTLSGALGQDTLMGGEGADVFRFSSLAESPASMLRDYISDFVSGVDLINLSAIQAVAGAAVDAAFTFLDKDSFTKQAGQLHQIKAGSNTVVEGDVNGDGRADLQILLKGHLDLEAGDFLL